MNLANPMSKRTQTYIFMILPAILLFIAFNTIPLITGAFYSLTNYRGYGSYDFVGLRNFKDLISGYKNWKILSFHIQICPLRNDSDKYNFADTCNGIKQSDKIQKYPERNIFSSKHSRRTYCRIYFQLHIHLYYSYSSKISWNKFYDQQYSCQ